MSIPQQDDCGVLLVVDDNEMNRDMLSRRLTRRGHVVHVAIDGHEALRLVGQIAFDVVLLDITMPGIDGIETLTILRRTFSAAELPVIMATAKDQSDDVVTALKAGANDYVTKPLDFPVVLARVQTQLSLKRAVDRNRDLEQTLKHHIEHLQKANSRMQNDLTAAARIQQSGLPNSPVHIDGLHFAWAYHPCEELGGDSLNILKLDDRHVAVYVLDVSGHGVPAALLSVTLNRQLMPHRDGSSLVTEPVPEPPGFRITPPAAVASKLNRNFQMSAGGNQFFTLLYGMLDRQTLRFRFVGAGHPGPVLAPANGDKPRVLNSPGFPIGVVEEAEYDEMEIQLEAGDRLFLYSDGIIEEPDIHGKAFGFERLVQAVAVQRNLTLAEGVKSILAEVHAWRRDGEMVQDDLSILAIEVE